MRVYSDIMEESQPLKELYYLCYRDSTDSIAGLPLQNQMFTEFVDASYHGDQLLKTFPKLTVWVDIKTDYSDLHDLSKLVDNGARWMNGDPVDGEITTNEIFAVADVIYPDSDSRLFGGSGFENALQAYFIDRQTWKGPKWKSIKRGAIWYCESNGHDWWPDKTYPEQFRLYKFSEKIIKTYLKLFPEKDI